MQATKTNVDLVHIPRGERLDSLGFGHLSLWRGLKWPGQRILIVDVSEGGIKFEIATQSWGKSTKKNSKLRPGTIRTFSIELNSFPGFQTELQVKVQIMWFDAESQRGGCTFSEATASEKQKINAFLSYLAESKQSNQQKLEELKPSG
jgi:hypothetical protein